MKALRTEQTTVGQYDAVITKKELSAEHWTDNDIITTIRRQENVSDCLAVGNEQLKV